MGKRVQIISLREDILKGIIVKRLTHTHPLVSKHIFFLVELDKEISFISPYFKFWHNFIRKKNKPEKKLCARFVIIEFRNPENIKKELHGFVESEFRAPIAAYLLDKSITESDNDKLYESDVKNRRSYPFGPVKVQIIENEIK